MCIVYKATLYYSPLFVLSLKIDIKSTANITANVLSYADGLYVNLTV